MKDEICDPDDMTRLIRFLCALSVAVSTALACSGQEQINGPEDDMVIVAHRGGASLGNENSLSCIAAGVASGADMIEIDVHLSRDGHVVVCHDPTLDRTTNGRGRIEDMDLQTIRSFRIVDSEGNPTGECIPTLQEVLQTIDARCGILLEIKRRRNQYEGIEERVLEILQEYGATGYTTIQSFNDRVLENTHALNPDIRLEKLIICRLFASNIIFDGTFTKFSWDKYSYISSFNFHYRFLGKKFLSKIHARGKEAKIWTVNSIGDYPRIPVDGIITDHPKEFVEMVSKDR